MTWTTSRTMFVLAVLLYSLLSLVSSMHISISELKCIEYQRSSSYSRGVIELEQNEVRCSAVLVSERFLLTSGDCGVDFRRSVWIVLSVAKKQRRDLFNVDGFTKYAELGLILIDIKQGIERLMPYIDCLPNDPEMTNERLDWLEDIVWPAGKSPPCDDDCSKLKILKQKGVL